MAPKLKIPGTSSGISANLDELRRDPITVQEVVDVTSARAAGGAVTVERTQPLPKGQQRQAGQVCGVELDGGITLWLRPGSLSRRERCGTRRRNDILKNSTSLKRREYA